ncbi:glycosyltransferase family protein [Shewanella xiamenensis]|uniref:hypothetical protein n=1 Tax=Shewanella xiamenensis TaxID=332186 RepID=UPI0021BF7C38|nr:hypothetical protein [Shewanella xiamenensis]MCT8864530.1 hypothetical protein [Shewanella xiamenensis]
MAQRHVIVESNMVSSQHVKFNSTCLNFFTRLNTVDFSLFCDQSHFIEVNKFINLSNIDYHPIKVVPGLERKFIKKFLYDFLSVLKVFLYAKRNNCKSVIFLSVFAPTLFLINVFSFFFRLKVKVILHSELEVLLDKSPSAPTFSGLSGLGSYRFWIVNYLKSNIRRLGEVNLYALAAHADECNLLKLRDYNVDVIDHPYFVDTYKVSEGKLRNYNDLNFLKNEEKIYIAFVGYARMERGIEHFFELAKAMNNNEFDDYFFVVLGDVDHRITIPSGLNNLALPFLGKGFVDNDLLNNSINEIDVIFYPYGNCSYRVSSSGAVFEYLHLNKLIVSFDNAYFNYLNASGVKNIKTFGDISAIKDYLKFRFSDSCVDYNGESSFSFYKLEAAFNQKLIKLLSK